MQADTIIINYYYHTIPALLQNEYVFFFTYVRTCINRDVGQFDI